MRPRSHTAPQCLADYFRQRIRRAPGGRPGRRRRIYVDDKIEKHARIAHAIVDDLMALARGEPLQSEPVLLVEALVAARADLDAGVASWEDALEPHDVRRAGPPPRAARALLHVLYENAIQACASAGIDNRDACPHPGSGRVVIEVGDDGPGVPAAVAPSRPSIRWSRRGLAARGWASRSRASHRDGSRRIRSISSTLRARGPAGATSRIELPDRAEGADAGMLLHPPRAARGLTTCRASTSISRTRAVRRDHRSERLGQVVARPRHPVRGGAAPLRRELQPVRAPVPRAARASPHGRARAHRRDGRRRPRAEVEASRSTLATMADLEPYLAGLFGREAIPTCPTCGLDAVDTSPRDAAARLAETALQGVAVIVTYAIGVDDAEQFLRAARAADQERLPAARRRRRDSGDRRGAAERRPPSPRRTGRGGRRSRERGNRPRHASARGHRDGVDAGAAGRAELRPTRGRTLSGQGPIRRGSSAPSARGSSSRRGRGSSRTTLLVRARMRASRGLRSRHRGRLGQGRSRSGTRRSRPALLMPWSGVGDRDPGARASEKLPARPARSPFEVRVAGPHRGAPSARHRRRGLVEEVRGSGVRACFAWLETRTYKMHVRVLSCALAARYAVRGTCTALASTRRPSLHRVAFGLNLASWHGLTVTEALDRLARIGRTIRKASACRRSSARGLATSTRSASDT